MRDAPILLLDEPTAALDTESEKLVIEATERLAASPNTKIVVMGPGQNQLPVLLNANKDRGDGQP